MSLVALEGLLQKIHLYANEPASHDRGESVRSAGESLGKPTPFSSTDKRSGLSLVETSLKVIRKRLRFLRQVGIGYLHLNRPTGTLSAGEAQRIQLASLLGSELTALTILVDEPSRGMHPAELEALREALQELRDEGNTLIILDSAVSRRHFEIYTDKHKWYVRDLNSRHGTFVNGFRIETMELEDGDRIRVGNMQLVFKDGS